ncbi:unnamed protein product, partial [marine sediment metagenome]
MSNEKHDTHHPAGIAKKIIKISLIIGGTVIVLLGAIVGIAYLLIPNEIVSFKQFNTNKDNQPIELTYTFFEESCTLRIRNAATDKEKRYTNYTTNQRLLYFDKAKGSMWFLGQEFLNRKAVRAYADKARRENNVSLKEIKMSKGQVLLSNRLSRAEIVWIKYHPKDA